MKQSRKYIIIVFSDISNSTELASKLEPEIYSDLLQAFRHVSEEVVKCHGGEIIRIDGDGLVIIFGHDTAYENSVRRAVDTALNLHESVSSMDPALLPKTVNLNLHTGIHGGIVLLKKGDSLSGKYEILGEPTNIARRLCDFAGVDQIMVSDDALGAERAYFKFGNLKHIIPRGTSSVLNVWPIQGRSEISSRLESRKDRASRTFVGRGSTLEKLGQWATDERGDEAQAILISAGAGMGKSRLISEFLTHNPSDDRAVYYASCDSYLGGKAMQPVRQWLGDICRSNFGLPTQRAEHREHLGKYFNAEVTQLLTSFLEGSETVGISNVVTIFRSVLDKVQPNFRLILCLDDWQWADQSTREIIITLIDNDVVRTKFLLASRETDESLLHSSGAVHIKLPALSPKEVNRLTQNMMGTASPFFLEKIVDQSGGSPLFVEEICYALNKGKALSLSSWENLSLASLTSTRLERLKSEQIEYLSVAAVLGFTFPKWLFEEITGVSVTSSEFRELSEKDFLYIGDISGTVRFKHAMTQNVVYNIIDYRKRKFIHARVVQCWLNRARQTGAAENNAIIALNLFHSDQFDQASSRAMLAGMAALKTGALDVAQENFKLSIEALLRMPVTESRDKQIVSVLNKFGMSSVVDPSKEHFDMIEKVAEVVRGNADLKGQAMTDYWRGFMLYGMGEPNQALKNFNSAKTKAVHVNNSKILQNLNNNFAQALTAACQYDAAIDYFQKIKNYERNQIKKGGSPVSFAYSLSCEGLMYADQGLFDLANQCFDEAEILCLNHADYVVLSVLDHRVAAEIWSGNYEQAKTYAHKILSMTARMRSRYHYVMATSLFHVASWFQKPKDEHIESLIQMTSWMEDKNLKQYVSINYGYLSHMSEVNNDTEKCRIYAARALSRARAGDRLGEAMACRSLTRLFNGCGHIARTKTYFERAQQSAQIRQSPRETKLNQALKDKLSF